MADGRAIAARFRVAATSAHTSNSVLDSITSQIVAATAAESGIVNLVQTCTTSQTVTVTGSASTEPAAKASNAAGSTIFVTGTSLVGLYSPAA